MSTADADADDDNGKAAPVFYGAAFIIGLIVHAGVFTRVPWLRLPDGCERTCECVIGSGLVVLQQEKYILKVLGFDCGQKRRTVLLILQ